MISKLSNTNKLLALKAKILVVGTLDEKFKNSIDIYFEHKEFFDLTNESLDIFNSSLYNQFDVVLFSFSKENFNLFIKDNESFPKNSLVIIDNDIYPSFINYVNMVDSILINPVSTELLLDKIYSVLCIRELDKLLRTKEKVIEKYKSNGVNEGIDTFLDQHSGEIMFINDDLNENLTRLKDLEFSDEIFKSLSFNLIKLSSVLNKNESLTHISNILHEFGNYLDELNLEDIEPSRYDAFDYLTNMIDDLTLYIDELFIYKLFKDVKIFEDSVENNIEYFKNYLLGKSEENDENLEFF